MKDIIIVCAGGYGLEVYSVILALNRTAESRNQEKPYNPIGFLSDVPDALEGNHAAHS